MDLGKNNLLSIFLTIICTIALITDIKKNKIYNWLTLPTLVLGLCFSLGSWAHFFQSMAGIVSGLILLGWIFALGHMGGGDVKLLMALGAWLGFRPIIEIVILSIVIGGVLAVIQLFIKKELLNFFQKLQVFFASILVKEMKTLTPNWNTKTKLPFAIAISLSTFWFLWAPRLGYQSYLFTGGMSWIR